MQTTITHICGHQEDIVVYGKRADREKKIAWLEAQLCAECRAREGAAQGAAKGWAALEGSPKQIAWAEDIRGKTMDAIAALKTRTDDEAAHKDRVIAYLGGITSAEWWIDNRFAGKGMIRRAVEHAKENGIDLTAAPVETAEETVEEPVEAADDNYLTVDDLFALAGLTVEDLFKAPEPPKPMTEEEKKQAEEEKAQYEFDRDVSTLVVLLGFLDDRADDRILCFKHDVVKAKGRDYWNKVAAAALDYQDKVIAAALE